MKISKAYQRVSILASQQKHSYFAILAGLLSITCFSLLLSTHTSALFLAKILRF